MKQGIVPIYEPGLEEMFHRNIQANRLFFTTKIKEALDKSDVIRHRISTAVRVSSLITIPAFVGLFFLSGPISKMLFNTWDAGPVIGAMSLGIFFLGLHQMKTFLFHIFFL